MSNSLAPPLIISVKEMRKLLGKDASAMTDDQVTELIITLTEASSVLLNSLVPKNQQVV